MIDVASSINAGKKTIGLIRLFLGFVVIVFPQSSNVILQHAIQKKEKQTSIMKLLFSFALAVTIFIIHDESTKVNIRSGKMHKWKAGEIMKIDKSAKKI